MAFLLTETNNYLLTEDNSKIILQEGISASASLSPSASISPSASVSPSSSISPSFSLSPSSSISASPSPGYALYSRGTLIKEGRYKYGGLNGMRWLYGQHIRYGGEKGLVVDDSDLSHIYTEQEEADVLAVDNLWVDQSGALVYMVHEFKSFVDNKSYCSLEWTGKSTLSPELSAVYFQVYNQVTKLWETFDSNNTSDEDMDFELEARVPNLTNYKNASSVISCRVYQLAL